MSVVADNLEVLSLTDEDFKDLVVRDIKGEASEAESEYLRSDNSIILRWIHFLEIVLRDVEAHLEEKDFKFYELKLDYESGYLAPKKYKEDLKQLIGWKNKASLFRRHTMNRLSEAYLFLDLPYTGSGLVFKQRYLALRAAIKAHQTCIAPNDAGDADTELWDTLDKIDEGDFDSILTDVK